METAIPEQRRARNICRRGLSIGFNLAAVVSLLLSLAALALWFISYQRADGFYFPVAPNQLVLYSQSGCIDLDWSDVGGTETFLRQHTEPATFTGLNLLTFTCNYRIIPFGVANSELQRLLNIGCPWWPVVLILAALPAIRGWLFVRRRGVDPKAQPCPTCGYDLRGSPDAPCPECGAKQTPTEILSNPAVTSCSEAS